METEDGGFVHLHVHTEYSLRQAACRLDELIRLAKSWNVTSLAITDKEAIHGAVRFCELAEQSGIHPVIGCEMEAGEPGESLIMLAVNNRGYEHIVEWLNETPIGRRALEQMHHLSKGDLIALSGGRNGMIYRLLAEGKTELAEAKALRYAKAFGEGNFYLEVQHHGPEDLPIMSLTERLSRKTGIPLVATHDVHYLYREDGKLLNLLRGEQSEHHDDQIDKPYGLPRKGSPPAAGALYLPSPQEMMEKFRHLPDALINTVKIANRCQVAFEPTHYKFPCFPVPEPFHTSEHYLTHLCRTGLTERTPLLSADHSELCKIEERMMRELEVINLRGLASYFLIVWDLVRFAGQRGIPVGPGRGSAAGSLVMYLLGITQVNPLTHGLSFERFLSEDRSGLPDIDLDVCQMRRQELLQYVKDKYGEDRVAHIGVWNTFGARGAVREAGKRLQFPIEQVNVVAKLLPALSGQGGLRHCLQTLPELQKLPVGREPYRSLFQMAECLEGLPRNQSVHPSGILIGPEELKRTVPLRKRPNGVRITSFTKEDVRTLGLLKIDLLGSRILTVIHNTLEVIRQNGETFEPSRIPLDDPETFRVLQEGDTLGCFQLESLGIRSLLRRMKPKHMEDLVALLALYRPGTGNADMTESYFRRRLGQEKVELPLPEMEPILAPTYGVVLYQEQVMQIVHAVAGYSMGEADMFRRMLTRKSGDDLYRQRKRFIRGALERGITEDRAVTAFDFVTRFVGYSFPKAHCVPYAYLSYWTVYLKTHHPKAYMASLLSLPGGYYDQRAYLRETVKMGIPLLRPDINRSGLGFCEEAEGIRVGLDAVKGSGPEAVASLLRSRLKDGDFTSLPDLLNRIKACRVGKPVLQGWVASGACDVFGESRRHMLDALAEAHHGSEKKTTASQLDFSESDKRIMEKRVLGFPLNAAPSERWVQFADEYNIVCVDALSRLPDRTRIRICGTVVHSRRQPTAGGGDYSLSLAVQDLSGMVEVVLYPNIYKAYLYELSPHGMIIEGLLRKDDGGPEIVAERIKALPSA